MSNFSVIIGGTSGIGLNLARYLRDNGYNVLAGGRTECQDETGIEFSHIDVSNELSIKNFFSLIPLKKIDSIIYAAGITTNRKKIVDFKVDEYLKIHNVNLLGAMLVFKYGYPFLKNAKGKVVVVSSLASRTYSKFSGFEYTVTKSGLSGLVKQLSIEWANDGILINMVFPSMVDTLMLRKNVDSDFLSSVESTIPLGRIAQPEEISPAIEFLISERNTYITGCGIDINGGLFLSV